MYNLYIIYMKTYFYTLYALSKYKLYIHHSEMHEEPLFEKLLDTFNFPKNNTGPQKKKLSVLGWRLYFSFVFFPAQK